MSVFGSLCNETYHSVQDALQEQAAHAVNLALTARNWLIGYYIVEFEQRGEDRAEYGEQLLKKLEISIKKKGMTERRFPGIQKIVYCLSPTWLRDCKIPCESSYSIP